ncbi:hypothetical protein C8R44DRAFT_7933 [Mycena epipterygia]|nr:hypothetical protein C8R44DRAFT_7933 [Mycena epipterygia]
MPPQSTLTADQATLAFLGLELHTKPSASRRSDIIHALDLLMCRPSAKAQAPLILQILLMQLETAPTDLILGIEILPVIARLSRHLQSADGPSLINALVYAWTKLFDWMWTHASHLDLPPNMSTVSRNSAYFTVAVDILSLYASSPALFHVSAENEDTPTTMLLVARLWYWRAKGFDSSIPSSITSLCRTYLESENSLFALQTRVVNLAIAAITPSIVTFDPEGDSLMQLASEANVGLSSIVELLIRRISKELAPPSPDISSGEAHLGILVALSHDRPCATHFITHQTPLVLTTVLSSLNHLSATAPTTDMPAIVRCLALCVEHVCLLFEGAMSVETLLEHMYGVILPVLLKVQAHIPQLNTSGATKYDAASLLKRLLATSPIAAQARLMESLQSIGQNGMEDIIVPNSPFEAAWTLFKEQVMQRMQAQARAEKRCNSNMVITTTPVYLFAAVKSRPSVWQK